MLNEVHQLSTFKDLLSANPGDLAVGGMAWSGDNAITGRRSGGREDGKQPSMAAMKGWHAEGGRASW